MTFEEAIYMMSQGHKLTHRYFDRHEWVTMPDPKTVMMEDGAEISLLTFINDRPSHVWNIDWEIFKEVTKTPQ